jgi:Ca2+-transporting ATPase
MVLTDDNFSTIEAAVEEGRGVYDNLLKFIAWTLPTNIGEGLVILVAVFWGRVLPILPVQILWINMTTAVLMGLMLAFEPKEPEIMARPPRAPASPILSRKIVFRMALVGLLLLLGAFGLFEEELRHGESLDAARTAAVNVFVVGELFYLFTCRSLVSSMFRLGLFTNRWLLTGVAAMAALQLLFTYHPVMNFLFHTEPIGLPEWRIIMLVGAAVYVVVELEKLFWRRRGDAASG